MKPVKSVSQIDGLVKGVCRPSLNQSNIKNTVSVSLILTANNAVSEEFYEEHGVDQFSDAITAVAQADNDFPVVYSVQVSAMSHYIEYVCASPLKRFSGEYSRLDEFDNQTLVRLGRRPGGVVFLEVAGSSALRAVENWHVVARDIRPRFRSIESSKKQNELSKKRDRDQTNGRCADRSINLPEPPQLAVPRCRDDLVNLLEVWIREYETMESKLFGDERRRVRTTFWWTLQAVLKDVDLAEFVASQGRQGREQKLADWLVRQAKTEPPQPIRHWGWAMVARDRKRAWEESIGWLRERLNIK